MKKFIYMFCIVCIVLVSFNIAHAFTMELPEKIGVDIDKVWTVEFNQPIDVTSLDGSIYIADVNGLKLSNYNVEINPENGLQVLVSPKTKWNEGTSYWLVLEKGIGSIGGNNLVIKTKMKFTTLRRGQWRIELEWGELPYDLDLQLYVKTLQKHYHFVHSTNPVVEGVAKLDVDVVTGYGIETLVIESVVSHNLYTIVVKQNTYEVAMGESDAVVRFYNIDGLQLERHVPKQLYPDLWGVAQFREGQLVPIRITY